MSPRRMDISSLLRDPSPPRTTSDDPAPRNADRPRTIDALLHHPHHQEATPASLLAILNSPSPSRTAPSPHHPPASSHPLPRPPFLGLDALVHVASEERRRISALSDTDLATTHSRFTEHDNLAIRPTLAHDHDWHARHYGIPLSSYPAPPHRHPDILQDSARPHKRARDSPPRSPSPEPKFTQLTSPSARLHSSASPINSYPTLRRQLIDPTPNRSTPALLAHSDTRSIQHHHTSPFLHSLHPLQLPPHPSPRNTSPHHHSPQHLRSHHHSSPIQAPSLISASAELDPMSPRYNHGPRMAGGIEVLSNDPIRDPPRHDLSNYQSPGREISVEHFLSESRLQHDRHELPKLSPHSARTFSPDDDDTSQPKLPSCQVQGQENVLLRERLRSRPLHLPLHATTDIGKGMGVLGMKTDSAGQPPVDRHPIRVWEEQPTVRVRSRRVSSARTPDIVCDFAERRPWSGANESGRLAMEGRRTELRPDVAEDVSTPPLSTSKEPPPPGAPISEPSASDSRPPIERNHLDSQPLSPTSIQPQSPVQSEPKTHLPQTVHPDSSTPHAPASPVLDLNLKNFETQSEFRPNRADMLVGASTNVPLPPSDAIVTEPLSCEKKQTLEVVDADDILMANPLPRQPSSEPAQSVLAEEAGTLETSNHSTHVTILQSTSRSPSQHPLPIPLPAKDERSALPDDVLIPSLIPPEPRSHRSPEPECTSERELPVSEPALTDVDEELLSLVEDRPIRGGPTPSRMQVESRSPLPIAVGQSAGAGAEQGPSEASDGPSLVLSSQPALKGPSLMTDEDKDRASMPPPAARNKKAENDKTSLIAGTTTGNRKKKDGTPKPAAKPKQPPKPRVKPAPKPKVKPNAVDSSSKGNLPKGAVNVNARSRSTSVIPGAVDDIVPEPDADNSDKEDDKLYCVCKTRYDEDRMMIACDRCDEWFHTLCVNMPDLEVDLVDQFICPPCIQKHPHLRTTWKRRCLFGLQHENPASPEACHRPSRGAFSKYCSDDCGIKYMRAHIAQWEKSGGVRDRLWENVKNAAKREGVVVCAKTNRASSPGMMDVDSNSSAPKPLDPAMKQRAEREVARLNARLEVVVKERELMKRALDMVIWRERVVELASERAAKVDECGWDQRLCFGEEEWADFGPEVLESYKEARVKVESGDDAMAVDAASGMHGEWWCTGKKKCERHAGWQKLRAAEVSFDKETKEGILLKLTTREREIRKCIEDILYPQPTGNLQALHPVQEGQLNGLEKLHVLERGKKRSS